MYQITTTTLWISNDRYLSKKIIIHHQSTLVRYSLRTVDSRYVPVNSDSTNPGTSCRRHGGFAVVLVGCAPCCLWSLGGRGADQDVHSSTAAIRADTAANTTRSGQGMGTLCVAGVHGEAGDAGDAAAVRSRSAQWVGSEPHSHMTNVHDTLVPRRG